MHYEHLPVGAADADYRDESANPCPDRDRGLIRPANGSPRDRSSTDASSRGDVRENLCLTCARITPPGLGVTMRSGFGPIGERGLEAIDDRLLGRAD